MHVYIYNRVPPGDAAAPRGYFVSDWRLMRVVYSLCRLTALEGIIEFIIDIYKSTFLCFLELAVRATLGVLIQATESFNSFVTSSLNSLRTGIQNDIASANNVIQGAVSAVNKVIPSFLNLQISVPQFDIPSLNALQNVTLPTTIQDGLTQLNTSIPTLDDIRDGLDQL